MPKLSAMAIHSSEPENPPTKAGFRMMYCGLIVSKSFFFSSKSIMPISSSSKAIGVGVSAHNLAISFQGTQ